VWLRNVDLAIERVAERVRRGGHSIPPAEIRRRYQRGINNLFELYIPIADTWAVYDNSEKERPFLVASGGIKDRIRTPRADLWKLVTESRPSSPYNV
jgi:predicted ABC-type ATPase